MDSKKYMVLINGEDKTDSVASLRFQDGMCGMVKKSAHPNYSIRRPDSAFVSTANA